MSSVGTPTRGAATSIGGSGCTDDIAAKASRQSNTSNISFAPDGSSSGGRIELAENGVRLLVGVDWLTGLVSVADAR